MISTPGRLRNVINKLIKVKPAVLEAIVHNVHMRKLLPMRGRMLSTFLHHLMFKLSKFDADHVFTDQE